MLTHNHSRHGLFPTHEGYSNGADTLTLAHTHADQCYRADAPAPTVHIIIQRMVGRLSQRDAIQPISV